MTGKLPQLIDNRVENSLFPESGLHMEKILQTLWMNLTLLYSLDQRTTGFLPVAAIAEPAVPEVTMKFPEAILQLLLADTPQTEAAYTG